MGSVAKPAAARMGCCARAVALLVVMLWAVSVEARDPTQSLLAAVHVHSRFSTGGLSLDELANEAERLSIDALVLADNLVLRYEYGLFPLRGVLKRRTTFSSVFEAGIDRYLAEVAEVQQRHPRVLLVPGVEIAPHYYWTGSLLDGNLTMHDSQKNLLVLGLERPADLLTLPVAGLPGAGQYGWETLLNMMPIVLLLPSAWLWRRGQCERVKMEGTSSRFQAAAFALGGAALVLLANAWPFVQPTFSFYERRLDYRPYQAAIDAITSRGGIAIWSMPEARDFNRHDLRPLGTVTVQTDPYAEALILTHGYTAFGGLYEDTRRAVEPGGVWDQALQLYLTGERLIPPFQTGESAFHGRGHDEKSLDRVLNVLEVTDRTPAGVIEAIRQGRLYAVEHYRPGFALRLARFHVECDKGLRAAGSGETLDPEGARDLAVQVVVTSTDGQAHPVSVNIVRSGQVIAQLRGETPLAYRFEDADVPPGQWHAYRLEVQGDGELLSNPVFVGPVPPPRATDSKS